MNRNKIAIAMIITVGLILLSGIIYKIYFKNTDKFPEPTNQIEEWDYAIFGYKTIQSGDKFYDIPITKIYTDSFCNLTISYNGLSKKFNLKMDNQKDTAYPPFYLVESGNSSNFFISQEYKPNKKINYTCYGKFIGVSK